MRRGLLWLLLPAVIVVLVWVAAATPLGWHTVTTQLERALSERTGLEVEIGSLEGNLLRRINIENVSLFDPAGLTIARVGTVSASYNAFALLRRRVAISELIIDDTDLLFDVDPNGDLVGWSRLAVADTSAGEESSGLGGWTIDARVAVRNLNAVVRDTGHGFALSLVGLDADASGGLDAYEAGLSCSLMIDYEGAAAAVAGRLRGSIAGSGSELVVRDFGLETAPVRVEGAARIAFPDAGGDSAARTAHVVEGRFGVDIALDELGLIVEGAHPTGAVSIGGSFEGPVDSLAYRAQIASDMVAFEGTEITGLIADVTGDPVAGQLRGLSARLAGGSLSASGAWRLAGSPDPGHGESDGQSEASFDVDVALRNADVAVLGAGIAAEQRPGGRLDLDLTLAAAALDPERLNGAGRAKIGGLTIGDRLIGDLDVEFGIESGDARAWGSCCGVEFDVRAALDAGAVDSLSFFASTADLSIPGAALGASELSGDGRVSGTILHPTDEPLLRVRADFPRLSFRDIETGPVVATAVGRSGVYEFGASVLDGAVTADGVFRETGTYEAALRVEDLGLERVVADSLRRLLALSGSFSGSAIVHGDTSGVFEAAGTVTALTTEIGEERMALERPTSFRASQRSLAVDDLTLSGTLGRVSIHGESADSLDLSITFADIDVGAAAALVPQRGGQLSPRGLLNGVVRLAGSLNEMRLAADATIEALGVGDIDVGTISCEVETDRE